MPVLAVAVGVAISLMLVANAALAQCLDPAAALLAVHCLGLVLVVPLAAFVPVGPTASGRVPWPLFAAGFVGVALILINNRTVPVLGAGFALALGVLGQLAASAAVDGFGLFGLPRRPFRPRRALGLAIAVGGAFLMGAAR